MIKFIFSSIDSISEVFLRYWVKMLSYKVKYSDVFSYPYPEMPFSRSFKILIN